MSVAVRGIVVAETRTSAGKGTEREAVAWAFHRIIRAPSVADDDPKPATTPGNPVLDPALDRKWAGQVLISVAFDRAADRARRFRSNLGRFVVAVTLPVEAVVEVEPIGSVPRRHASHGDPQEFRSFAVEPPKRDDEEHGR